jgi:hypothetical protein
MSGAQAFRANARSWRDVPEQPAHSAPIGHMSIHPVRWGFLCDYTENNKIFWEWLAMFGSIVYMNSSCAANL